MRTIWYMGAKTRLLREIVDAVADVAPGAGPALDLMSGTGAVAHALAATRPVVANDVQAYAAAIAEGYLCTPLDLAPDPAVDLGPAYRRNRDALLAALRPAVAAEDAFVRAVGLEPAAGDPDDDSGGGVGWRDAYDPGPPPATLAPPPPSSPAKGPGVEAALARAYRAFALEGTPRFLEVADPPVAGPLADAAALCARAAVHARRRAPGTFPYALASTYYPNVYLGVRQAIAVDALRWAIDDLARTGGPRGALLARHHLAALLHAVSVATSATSHFCQPRGLGRDAEVKAVLARRALSISSKLAAYSRAITAAVRGRPGGHAHRVLVGDWREALARAGEVACVYADPPYTADHYSRFYHALEVLTVYDYPALEVRGGAPTKGRYPTRAARARSGFCVRGQVERELAQVASGVAARGAALVLSYGEENGLALRAWRDRGASRRAARDRFLGLFRAAYEQVELRPYPLLHSGQGDSNHTVTELLVLARGPRRPARARRPRAAAAGDGARAAPREAPCG